MAAAPIHKEIPVHRVSRAERTEALEAEEAKAEQRLHRAEADVARLEEEKAELAPHPHSHPTPRPAPARYIVVHDCVGNHTRGDVLREDQLESGSIDRLLERGAIADVTDHDGIALHTLYTTLRRHV